VDIVRRKKKQGDGSKAVYIYLRDLYVPEKGEPYCDAEGGHRERLLLLGREDAADFWLQARRGCGEYGPEATEAITRAARAFMEWGIKDEIKFRNRLVTWAEVPPRRK